MYKRQRKASFSSVRNWLLPFCPLSSAEIRKSLLEFIESLLEVLDEFDRTHVLAIVIVDGHVADADRAAHDAAIDLHLGALLRLEVEYHLAHNGDDLGRMAAVDLAPERRERTREDLALIDEIAQDVILVDRCV